MSNFTAYSTVPLCPSCGGVWGNCCSAGGWTHPLEEEQRLQKSINQAIHRVRIAHSKRPQKRTAHRRRLGAPRPAAPLLVAAVSHRHYASR